VLEEVFERLIPLRTNPPTEPLAEGFYAVKKLKKGFSARRLDT